MDGYLPTYWFVLLKGYPNQFSKELETSVSFASGQTTLPQCTCGLRITNLLVVSQSYRH
jgi:hypothetical protein